MKLSGKRETNMPNFMPGTSNPNITHDRGAGPWATEFPTPETVTFKAAFMQFWPQAVVVIGDDAVKHMAHYLDCTGFNFRIDLAGMVKETPSAKKRYDDELLHAQIYAEGLRLGRHQFTSACAKSGYNQQNENKNWYFAIGGYSVWSKGSVNVYMDRSNQKVFELEFEYWFADRYNWDGGKSVTLFRGTPFAVTITDAFMGRMHRQGIAREFDCWGSIRQSYVWAKPVAVQPGIPAQPPGRGIEPRLPARNYPPAATPTRSYIPNPPGR